MYAYRTSPITLLHVPTCMCSVDMSRGLMSCSMDRLKMHVQRRHSVRENVCTISLLESTTVFSHMNNSVCFVCHVSVHMCKSVCASVYLCGVSVCMCVSVCMSVYCVCVFVSVCLLCVCMCVYMYCVCESV